MLYDIDDGNEIMEEFKNRSHYRKKAIICGVIVLICIIVMIVSIVVSIKMKNSDSVNVTTGKISKEEKANVYQGEHFQIAEHSLEQISSKFTPKHNDNAQEEITNIYYSDEKVAYLTFDDGPSKNITPQILDILKQENVPATFFVLGSRVELNPTVLKREYDEGHYIANHGYSHEYSKIYSSKETVLEEYLKTEDSIRNALNNPEYNTFLFRFPGGSSGGRYDDIKSEAKEYLKENNVNYTNWNCLTGDAEGNTDVDSLMNCLIETMEGDGSLVILMHDASDKSYTVEALPSVISYLRDQGYTFKNFYEIF